MKKSAIGIDFGGTTVKAGVVSEGKIVARVAPLRTHDFPGHDPLLAAIRAAIIPMAFPGSPGISARSKNMLATCRSRSARKSSIRTPA
jgi:hypothetical protein